MAHAPHPPNRLSREPSPYLRQHANNPVDWYPWGEEALALARQLNRPILLSVGYSACHWCHVMAHESFEDAQMALLMNAYFVNIKVDREERPDLDQIYQGVVQLMGQGGGWPLTVFLTPDLRPFFGGTYFPPEDRYGRPGFKKLLQALHEAWTTKPAEVEKQAAAFHEGLGELATYGLEAPASALQPGDITAAAATLLKRMDPVYGGFGTAPKFPNPMNVAMLLRAWRRSRDPALKEAVLRTLEKMAQGGLYDQLGGGFHRYSTDQRWLVPHFEKMLYDNAQLLHLYAEAEQVAPRPLWRKVAEETVAYLQREMLSPDGAFYATQDADSEGEEGRFFVWRPSEIAVVLPHERAELLMRHFGVTPQGNFEGGASVLEVAVPVEQLAQERGVAPAQVERELAESRALLLAAREKRVKPGRDDKILAGWNGLAIRGLALAARAFGRPDWAELAAGAAHFVLAQMWDGERLSHTHQEGTARSANAVDGFLEDYGGMAAGLTALYQATFNPRYLEAAEALASRAEALFWDEARQAYLSAPKGMKDLVVETYSLFDNASPSGASTLTEAQVTLAALTGQKAHLDRAERYLTRMRAQLQQNPIGYGHLLLAADAYLDGAAELTLAGTRAAVAPLLEVVDRGYAPTVAVGLHDPKAPVSSLLREAFAGRDPVRGKGAAYLCRHFVCERPVTDPEELRQKLNSVR